jgi:hypothetical protein
VVVVLVLRTVFVACVFVSRTVFVVRSRLVYVFLGAWTQGHAAGE